MRAGFEDGETLTIRQRGINMDVWMTKMLIGLYAAKN